MKRVLKHIVFILAAVLIFPVTAMCIFMGFLFSQDQVLTSCSQFLSLLPGKSGVYLRAGFYRFTLTRCSPDAVISFLVLFPLGILISFSFLAWCAVKYVGGLSYMS